MSGSSGSKPWNPGNPLDLSPFPNVLFADRYERIHEFLRDQKLVRDGLLRLDMATAGMGQPACRAYLAAEEKRFGFSPIIATITEQDDLIKASRFWTYLYQRQALIDIGAGDADHGVLIHRVQWVLIGQWNERTNGTVGPIRIIGELYGNLGAANARVLSAQGRQILAAGGQINTGAQGQRPFESVWDELCDAFPQPKGRYPAPQNATVPEYLRLYIEQRLADLHNRLLW